MRETAEWSVKFDVSKVDTERRHVYGWLSVSEDKNGRLIIDKQGDFIFPEDLEKTAKEFMLSVEDAAFKRGVAKGKGEVAKSGVLGEMHDRIGVGRVFESMVFTREKLAKLGLTGKLPVGWWIGAEVTDPSLWAKVKDGHRPAWSIGGSGRRIAA